MSLRARLPVLVPDSCALDDDRVLVRRFAESRDEAAFAAVVARHARMVYGVCRRAIRDEHLAEDAFQAVFLVLANNPARAISASAVGGWLFGIARRVGLAARRSEERYAKRQMKHQRARSSPEQPDFDDLLRVLDEELAALPDEFRAPLVACFLEERTLDEAARQLGWSVSTLRRRLDRAKDLLRGRLLRRGAALSAGLFAGFLAPSARAAVPARLIEAVIPSAPSSALAKTLAAEVTRGSAALKAGLAAVVVALGLGGVALGINPEADQLETRPLLAPAHHPVALAPAPRVAEAKWPTVRGRILFPGGKRIPSLRPVPGNTIKDAEFFGSQVYRDVLIDAPTRGIANAVVWLRPDTDGEQDAFPTGSIHPTLAQARSVDRSILLTHEGFTPRVTAARTGDRLVFSNSTPVFFTVRCETPVEEGPRNGAANSRFNVLLPPGQTHATATLPGPHGRDTLADNIHSWVRGVVWSFDHPYFAVTDAQGNFAIENAPPGTWRLVVWHEKAGYRNGTAGRLGERITIAPGAERKTITLESARWDE